HFSTIFSYLFLCLSLEESLHPEVLDTTTLFSTDASSSSPLLAGGI
ncbi:unnamed protein product, partial [Musa acuminata subsp. malaccensis]